MDEVWLLPLNNELNDRRLRGRMLIGPSRKDQEEKSKACRNNVPKRHPHLPYVPYVWFKVGGKGIGWRV